MRSADAAPVENGGAHQRAPGSWSALKLAAAGARTVFIKGLHRIDLGLTLKFNMQYLGK